jgi:Putative metallopeptidase
MRKFAGTAAVAFALLSVSAPASAQQAASRIKIAYEEPTNAQLRPIYERLKQRHVLETLQAFLTPLRLPRELTVKTAQCGSTNVVYKPQGPATVCYELVNQIEQVVFRRTKDERSQQTVIAGAFIQAVLHETALAIFDMLEVPIWGRKDDAADRLAALIMMQFGDDVANTAMLGTIYLFQWSNNTWTGRDFASAASPEAQRFFNYACIAVAGNYPAFGGLVEKKMIPASRARQCENEYDQIRKAFNMRIMPYVDADLLVKVRATPWLTWTPGK